MAGGGLNKRDKGSVWGNQGQKKEGYPRLLVLPSFRDHPKSRCGENVCGGGGEGSVCGGGARPRGRSRCRKQHSRTGDVPFFFFVV